MKLTQDDSGNYIVVFPNGDKMIFATEEIADRVMQVIDRYVQNEIESAVAEHEERL